ncbi:MAG: carbohydrate kinase [Chitinophagaceae bacterium]|nr:MAG: PfkB domain-containing protein [Bacteroidetes bacterium OLB11]MCC6448791.1 carbohydrate kinase [Chitinophagaceae bacterium]HMN31883.1 bifunctional ADP-heptose synthase [Chitinophagaceae bacterium]
MKSKEKLDAKQLFQKINSLKVFVVGDAMIDNYWYGTVDRISPEAPVPIISITQKESRLGGAANVALNCKSLGAEVYLCSYIGKDNSGSQLISMLKEQNIRPDFCIQSEERITTNKTRIISKNQQILRVDEESTSYLSLNEEHHFIDVCLRAIQIEKPDILIFEDYNKGLLSELVIEKIIKHCKHVGVFTSVDPKQKHFFSYQNIDLFKPNLKEVKEAFGIDHFELTKPALEEIHLKLHEKLNHQTTLITLSENGVFVRNEKEADLMPAHVRKIADVSGAGDTVIAVATILLFLSNDISFAAQVANLAGGLVCEEPGVARIQKEKLMKEINKKLV